ncbi:MAG: sulfite exporter TauE/SafE family protein [Dehalococcoidia bacterium]
MVEVFFFGLLTGIGPCVIHIAPMLGFFAAGEGWRKGIVAALAFSFSRLLGHTLLGAGAGLIGISLVSYLGAGELVAWARIGASSFIIFLGMLIILGKQPRVHLCQTLNRYFVHKPLLSMALLGFLVSITPYCAPFLGVLTYIVMMGDVWLGALYSFSFGLGAVVALLILGPLAGLLPRLVFKTPRIFEFFRRGCGALLLLFGIRLLLTAIGGL